VRASAQVRLIRSGISRQPLLEDEESLGPALLVRWAQAALGGDATRANEVACVLLQEQAAYMEQQLASVKELEVALVGQGDSEAGREGESSKKGQLPSANRRANLLTVFEGAVRAAKEGPRQLHCAA